MPAARCWRRSRTRSGTSALSLRLAVLKQRARGHDPGRVIRDLAVMLADGGECVSDLGAVRDHQALFGAVASDSTAFRVVDRVATEPGLLDALRFANWFRALDLDSPFFEVAADLAQVSAARPFFPTRQPARRCAHVGRLRRAQALDRRRDAAAPRRAAGGNADRDDPQGDPPVHQEARRPGRAGGLLRATAARPPRQARAGRNKRLESIRDRQRRGVVEHEAKAPELGTDGSILAMRRIPRKVFEQVISSLRVCRPDVSKPCRVRLSEFMRHVVAVYSRRLLEVAALHIVVRRAGRACG
jgi:hypothetical protein